MSRAATCQYRRVYARTVLMKTCQASDETTSRTPSGSFESRTATSPEGGRGLFLVAALSTRWDWYLTQEPAGKVVWCVLQAGPGPSEGAGSAAPALLPRRIRREQEKRPV